MPKKRKQGSRGARHAPPTAPSEPAANFSLASGEREARVLYSACSDDSDAAHQPQKRRKRAAEAPLTRTTPDVVKSQASAPFRRLRRANGGSRITCGSPDFAPTQNAAEGARHQRLRRGSGTRGSDVKERLVAAQRQFKEGCIGRQRPSDTTTSSSSKSESDYSELAPSQSSGAPLEDDLGENLEDDLEDDFEEMDTHSLEDSLATGGSCQSLRGDMGDDEAVCTLSGEGADDDLADFIVDDTEDAEWDRGGAAPGQLNELQTVLEVLTGGLTRGSGYIYLTHEWPCYVAGLVFRYLGICMPEELAAESWAAKLKVARILDSTRDEISSNLGWVNAEKVGLLRAMKALPLLSTGWDFSRGMDDWRPDAEVEEERDGHFTCQACGRSTGPVMPVTLSGCPYDRDQLGRLQWQKEESAVFQVAQDCAQRVMLTHLLQHWEWAVAEKLGAEVKRVYDTITSSALDRAQLAAMAILADVGLIRDLFLNTNQAMALGTKLQVTKAYRRDSQASSSTDIIDVGGEVLRLTKAMGPLHCHRSNL